jgi:exopolyphosphatase/guanosine-5'-triphosphate,3'-diphosphate pyrophosphatase
MPNQQTPNTNKRVAVMDLGTNTFHLLIAEGPAENFKVVFHTTDAVKLGEGGINKGTIQPEAFARGLAAMQRFQDLILEHKVTAVRAIATSAIRSAANGQDFIKQVEKETGIQIEPINGAQEAAYIYKGIDASGVLSDENVLIMDIGGGSVEFIIGNNDEVHWKQSFEIGAARLMDKFHQTDPIPLQSIKELSRYLDGNLTELFGAAIKYKPKLIIGSSGAFESFAEVIEIKNGRTFNLEQTKVYEFDTDDLLDLIELLIKSTHALRASIKGIIPVRVDMIVVASLITIYIMQKLGLPDVTMCSYSLKEGVLADTLA